MLLLLCICDSLNKLYTLLQQIPSSEVFWISPWNLIPDRQLVQDLERPDGSFSVTPVVASYLSLFQGVYPLCRGACNEIFLFVKMHPLCILHYVTSHQWAFDHIYCFVFSGRRGGHRSTVLNSLMQFNNATYSFHVSLGSFTCEITEPCLAWLTQRSRGRVTPKRQMWEGERN